MIEYGLLGGVKMSNQTLKEEIAHAEAVNSPINVVVHKLRELLGAKLVAFLGDVKETRAVREWANGEREPNSSEVEARLRAALQISEVLLIKNDPKIIQVWFQGMNPLLNDKSPIRALKDGNVDDYSIVLKAAKRFSEIG